MNPTSWLNSVS